MPTRTYMGLAVPLGDAFNSITTIAGADTTKKLNINGAGAWGAGDCVFGHAIQTVISGTPGAISTGLFVGIDSTSTGARQEFGLMVDMTLESGSSNSGGRNAVLQLSWQDKSDNYTNAMANSFINFYTLDGHCPALFTILTNAWGEADHANEFFVTATNTTIDHALKIYVDNVVYYIGLYDATSGS